LAACTMTVGEDEQLVVAVVCSALRSWRAGYRAGQGVL
jgi:hypothetical protein